MSLLTADYTNNENRYIIALDNSFDNVQIYILEAGSEILVASSKRTVYTGIIKHYNYISYINIYAGGHYK